MRRGMEARTAQRALLSLASGLLKRHYGTPRLGNKRHPVSELVFIILSARTRGRNHEATYRDLRRTYPTWEEVRDAPIRNVARVLRDSGLSRIKAGQIQGALRKLSNDFGSLDGRFFKRMSDLELEAYLTTLPGTGLKTARCVMMYSLDRQVFPVDTHCIRLFQNLGILRGRPRFELAQNPLQDLVPNEIRRELHVNTVAHGRAICVPGATRCNECVIRELCINKRTKAP